jgi:hypothetical protein
MSKRLLGLALGLLLAVGCSGVDWQEYNSTEGRFTIAVPGKPEPKSATIETPIGPLTFTGVGVASGGAEYLAEWADMPADTEPSLKGQVEAVARADKSKVVSESDVEVTGQKGKSFELEANDGKAHAVGRIILYKNRLYRLQVSGAKVNGSSAEAKKFLDSFKLKDPLMKEGKPG